MDDTEDDARYPPNSYGGGGGGGSHQGYGSSNRQKLPVRNAAYSRSAGDEYVDDDDDDEENDDFMVEERNSIRNNGVRGIERNLDGDDDSDDEEEDEDDEDIDDDDDEDEHDEDGDRPKEYTRTNDVDYEKHPKKRKLKSLASSYEFAARVPPLAAAAPTAPKSSGGRNALTDWTEHETFVLLDAWGERFLHRGRKSLRSDEWQEVADKVSQVSKIERTDTQCRNRLDTLKKKYKKEKTNLAETGATTSKWVYFKKMDMLMQTAPMQGGGGGGGSGGLSCGLDSGEYVFSNPRVHSTRANGLDEMRDSPANSESADDGEDDSDELPLKKRKSGRQSEEGSSLRLLADSIKKFSKIYEKIENSKRKQMLELEKMRMDFHRELEMQKRQIMERAQDEIARLQQDDDEEN